MLDFGTHCLQSNMSGAARVECPLRCRSSAPYTYLANPNTVMVLGIPCRVQYAKPNKKTHREQRHIYMCTYPRIFVYVNAHMYCIHIHIVCIYACIVFNTYIHIYIRACMHAYGHAYVYIQVYMSSTYMHMYIHLYICV